MINGHGGNIFEFSKKAGLKPEEIIDVSASLSPLATPEKIVSAIRGCADKVNHYPEITAQSLIEIYACYLGISASNMLAGAGSTEFIYLLPRALKPKNIIIPQPSYSDYKASAQAAGINIKEIVTNEDNGFVLNIDDIKAIAKNGDMVFICNPNNPAGTYIDREILIDFAKAAPDITLVIDEAYVSFMGKEFSCQEKSIPENIIILNSPTKFYNIPGIRLGFCISHEKIISKLLRYKEPWTVSTPAISAGKTIPDCKKHTQDVRNIIKEESSFMQEKLSAIKNLKFFKPSANFILCKILSEITAQELQQLCLKDKILIRDASNFCGLDKFFFRIAIKDKDTNVKVYESLKKNLRTRQII